MVARKAGRTEVAISCDQSLRSEARPIPRTVRFSQPARRGNSFSVTRERLWRNARGMLPWPRMSPLTDTRLKIRRELEAPPALRRFGSGWISGVLGLVLGVAGFLFVLSLRAPTLFSMAELRPLHDNVYLRLGLHFMLLLAFAFSALSL